MRCSCFRATCAGHPNVSRSRCRRARATLISGTVPVSREDATTVRYPLKPRSRKCPRDVDPALSGSQARCIEERGKDAAGCTSETYPDFRIVPTDSEGKKNWTRYTDTPPGRASQLSERCINHSNRIRHTGTTGTSSRFSREGFCTPQGSITSTSPVGIAVSV